MRSYIIAYVATAIVMLGLDAIWLGVVARTFYAAQLGPMMRQPPNFTAAGIFYLLFVAGIVILAVSPALRSGSWTTALALGAVLGMVSYATYDLTNLATLNGWPATMTYVDLIWGTCLTAVAATGGYLAVRAIG